MSESVLSGVLELELPSLARLLTLVSILMDKRPNLTGADSYASVAIAWSRATLYYYMLSTDLGKYNIFGQNRKKKMSK